MEYDERLERKSKRVRRRNFVAKHNRHRAKRHKSNADYHRHLKHPHQHEPSKVGSNQDAPGKAHSVMALAFLYSSGGPVSVSSN